MFGKVINEMVSGERKRRERAGGEGRGGGGGKVEGRGEEGMGGRVCVNITRVFPSLLRML